LQEALLRPATERDLETLRVLIREFYEYEQRAYTPEKVQALLGLLRNSSFGKVALLCDGESAAGYVVVTYGYSIEFHGRDLLIDDLYIREEYRGRGWGTWTLGEIEKMARAEGLHAVHLEVARRNARARRFYDRAGFEPHDGDFLSKRLGGSLSIIR
jgi:ribosomal protein S18 acetylase RimI-like enzyme